MMSLLVGWNESGPAVARRFTVHVFFRAGSDAGNREDVALADMQLCGRGGVNRCMLGVAVSQVCEMRGSFLLLGLMVFGGFFELIGCPLMMVSGDLIVLPGFRHVISSL
jgi:hypothetical protein